MIPAVHTSVIGLVVAVLLLACGQQRAEALGRLVGPR